MTKLIVESHDIFVREIGIFGTQEELDYAMNTNALEDGEYFATIPMGIPQEDEDKSALEMAEDEMDWADRNNEI